VTSQFIGIHDNPQMMDILDMAIQVGWAREGQF
jgi:hypothetical protein